MIDLKYIIFDDVYVVVFTATIKHVDVARNIGMQPTSAGFCRIFSEDDKMEISAWGESVSLDISSKEDDADIIRRCLEFKY